MTRLGIIGQQSLVELLVSHPPRPALVAGGGPRRRAPGRDRAVSGPGWAGAGGPAQWNVGLRHRAVVSETPRAGQHPDTALQQDTDTVTARTEVQRWCRQCSEAVSQPGDS